MSEEPQDKATADKKAANRPQDAEQEKGYVDLEPNEEESAHIKGGSSRR